MSHGTNERQDPFRELGEMELEPRSEVIPPALSRPPSPNGRKSALHPSERKRRQRRMGVTFSDRNIPDRLRALAKRWGMIAPDGRSPNVSALLEYLLLPQLVAAERGEIASPEEAKSDTPQRPDLGSECAQVL